MRHGRLGTVVALVAAWGAGAGLVGCGDNASGVGGGGATPLDTGGAVQIAVVSAPSNLTCLRVTVTGNVTSVQFISITPGASTQLSLTGLPTGAVTVRADGFSTACGMVTATSVPAWVSNTASATLVAGVSSTVPLTMTPNGSATVQVNFPTPTSTTDTTPPTLVSFTPVNGATGVAETSAVVATFSEPVSLMSITPATFSVTDGTLTAPGNFTTLGNTAVFTASPALGPMQTYTARISPGVRDLAGNALVTGASWTFRTQDGTWDPFPTQLSNFGATVANVGTVASGRGTAGDTFAIWSEFDQTTQIATIFAAQFQESRVPIGTGWTTPVALAAATQDLPDVFSMVVDLAGNATAIWEDSFFNASGQETGNQVRAVHFTPATGWAAPVLLDAAGSSPSLAIDGSGNVTAAWVSSGGGTVSNLVASQLTVATGGWGTPVVLQVLSSFSLPIALAADPSGNVTAVWGASDQSFGTVSLWSARFLPTSGWGAPQLIESDNRGNAGGPSAAADPAGNVVAVWSQSDGTFANTVANRFVPATGWGIPQIIDNFTTGNTFSAQVGVDASGNAIAAWSQSDSSVAQVAASRFSPASGWSAAQVLGSVVASASLQGPALAVDGAGNAMVDWTELTTSAFSGNLRVARFTPATGWGPATTQIAQSESGAVTVDGFGRITIDAFSVSAPSTFPNILAVLRFE